MFDCIIPIGQTCNISFLLQNAKIKKQTTLFEWFVSPSLRDITNILIKIGNKTDNDIIKKKNNHIYIGDEIYTGHYNYEDFKTIYQRRRDRMIDIIKSNNKILFCRFEEKTSCYDKTDIDDFINSILIINPKLSKLNLLLITPMIELEHPSLIKIIYNNHKNDPYCNGQEINNLFINTLESIGYNLENTSDILFTDKSIF